MQTEMEVTDKGTCKGVAAADDALRQHEELRVEMEAREDNFTSLMEAGTILIQQQHYANEEVMYRCYFVLLCSLGFIPFEKNTISFIFFILL